MLPRSVMAGRGNVPDKARKRIEATALGLLAALPALPYVTFFLRNGVPRFGLFGDFALLEHATRHSWTGDTLLGPYSRFHWHHPGPLFFYFVAPFQAMFGESSTGLYVGTCFVNAVSSAAIVASMRLFASRAHGLASLFVVLAWFVAFGNVTANPWNPLAVVLPMTAYLVAAAMFARGRSAAVYPAVVFGALVTQAHIAVVTTVLATGAVALVAFLVGERRQHAAPGEKWLGAEARRRLAIAAGGLLLLFAPPILEQLTAPETGNVTRIVRFFLHRPAPPKPLSLAFCHWTTATSWLPDRVLDGSLSRENYIPMVMRWDAMPEHITATARTLTTMHLVLTIVAVIIARRRKDASSVSVLAFGILANAIAITALQSIVGVSYYYLVFWTTAGSSVGWIGVLSTLFSAVEDRVRMPRLRAATTSALLAGGVVASMATTSMQAVWFAGHPVPPASRPAESAELRAVYSKLRERLGSDMVAVIHSEGAWDMAYGTLLELEKDRIDVRVPAQDRWLYAGMRSPEGVAKPLHVWFSTTPLPLPLASCLDLVTKSGDVSMYAALTDDKTACAP